MSPNATGRANRLAPDGSLHAVGARGTMWGNRGALLDARGDLARHANGRNWICCVLEFHGRHRDQWRPGRLTELYVLDEATALAAGHRPCGECRHAAYVDFKRRWLGLFPDDTSATAIDRRLHAARLVTPSEHRTYEAPLASLPVGTFVEHQGRFWLFLDETVRPWSFNGYGPARPRSDLPDRVVVRTPEPTVAVLGAGYRPVLHPSTDIGHGSTQAWLIGTPS